MGTPLRGGLEWHVTQRVLIICRTLQYGDVGAPGAPVPASTRGPGPPAVESSPAPPPELELPPVPAPCSPPMPVGGSLLEPPLPSGAEEISPIWATQPHTRRPTALAIQRIFMSAIFVNLEGI
jgi:hypothetical protein